MSLINEMEIISQTQPILYVEKIEIAPDEFIAGKSTWEPISIIVSNNKKNNEIIATQISKQSEACSKPDMRKWYQKFNYKRPERAPASYYKFNYTMTGWDIEGAFIGGVDYKDDIILTIIYDNAYIREP